jgi:hypothetical protein
MNLKLTTALVLGIPMLSHAQDVLKYDKELHAIAQIESSNGRNKNHKTVVVGRQRGTTAAGSYGLMPYSVLELMKYDFYVGQKYAFLSGMTPNEITNYLNSDILADREIASRMWKRLRRRDSAEVSACSWYRGRGNCENASDEELLADEYVQKFEKILNPERMMAGE